MKRHFAPFVLSATGLALALAFAQALALPGPAVAEIQRRPMVRHPVTVHRDWPLKRRTHEVIVRQRHAKPRVRVEPRIYIPPVIFPGLPFLPPPPPGITHRRDSDYRPGDESDRRRDRRPDYRSQYKRERLVWEDHETLFRDEEWVEFTLDCNARGVKLWFEVKDGRTRIDWAEVVFENGDAQVVDFSERSIGPGLYPLLDFRDGRRVDHVRMVAKSVSREVKLILRMEK